VPPRGDLKVLSVHLPDTYIEGLAELVNLKFYANRSEAIRVAIRDLLRRELWEGRQGSWMEEVKMRIRA
jgi:Arc/MetJ-type ribon-helix-helix transcriptional regulator